LSNVLRQIQDILAGDDRLSKMVRYSIKERGQNEKLRLLKLYQYRGPDEETIHVLGQRREEWMRDPARFWTLPLPPDINLLNARAQIVRCFLRAKGDDA
jgi:hypothetical protein